jgi:hypothetical protein
MTIDEILVIDAKEHLKITVTEKTNKGNVVSTTTRVCLNKRV